MNLYNIITKAFTTKLSGFGSGTLTTAGNSSPIATMLKPIKQWYNTLIQRQPGYDALALAMASVPEVTESAALDQGESLFDRENISETIEVSEESAEALMSGVTQAKALLAPDDPLLCITSVTGLSYSMQIGEDEIGCVDGNLNVIPVLYKDQETDKYYLRTKWPSCIFRGATGSQGDDLFSRTQRICNYLGVIPKDSSLSAMWRGICRHYGIHEPIHATYLMMISDVGAYLGLPQAAAPILVPQIEDTVKSSLYTSVSASDSFLTIVGGLTVSGTINSVLADSCSSIFNHSWKDLGSYLTDKYYGAKDSIKLLINRIKQALSAGGLRGLISTLISIIETQSSLSQEDSILVYTNNGAQLPREFIVGLVGQVISSVISIIGAVVSIVAPVIGVLASVAGMVLSSLFSSLKQNVSDTHASVYVPETLDDTIDALPVAPVSFLRGEVNISSGFQWYQSFYSNIGDNATIEVPGGYLFVGPGSFDQNGAVETVRYEFHPYAKILNVTELHSRFSSWVTSYRHSEHGQTHMQDYRSAIPPMSHTTFAHAWFAFVESGEAFDVDKDNEPASGVLSDDNNKQLLVSTAACLGAFILWFSLMQNDATIQEYIDNPDVWLSAAACALDVDDDQDKLDACLVEAFLSLCVTDFSATFDHLKFVIKRTVYINFDWTDLVKRCIYSCDHAEITPCSLSTVVEQTGIDVLQPFEYLGADTNSNQFAYWCRYLTETSDSHPWNYGDPLVLPSSPQYICAIPKYNKSTFWLWTSLALAVTTAVAVGVTVASVKFSKWRKRKRLDAVINTNDARETYTNAKSGFKYNDQTGKYDIPFDVNSPEGQQYVNDTYKAYKKTVFTANLQSHVVGGTRYDTTSFYGDAVSDESSAEDESNGFLSRLLSGDDSESNIDASSGEAMTVNFAPLIKLISGVE